MTINALLIMTFDHNSARDSTCKHFTRPYPASMFYVPSYSKSLFIFGRSTWIKSCAVIGYPTLPVRETRRVPEQLSAMFTCRDNKGDELSNQAQKCYIHCLGWSRHIRDRSTNQVAANSNYIYFLLIAFQEYSPRWKWLQITLENGQ